MYDTAIIDFDSRNVPVNLTEQRVLDEIRINPSATYDEIANAIGKTRKTVSRAITELKQRDQIRREGSDKSDIWTVR